MGSIGEAVNVGGWGQPLLTAALTLFGLIVTQLVLIWLYKRGESKRLDPFLVQSCAAYSSAVGRLSVQLHENSLLVDFADYEKVSRELSMIAPHDIQLVIEQIQMDVYFAIDYYAQNEMDECEQSISDLFEHHKIFEEVARTTFGRQDNVRKISPIMDSSDIATFGTRP
jgi:hypothetical protein